MIYAKELLELGIYNVQEVSEMIGYQNAGKFSKSFKNQFNLLPHKIISTSKTG